MRCSVQQVQDTLLPVGTIIQNGSRDRYVVERLLGKGGFGAIYLVRDQRVKQNLFALKEVINPSERGRERFTFECEVLMRLDHQALPRVYRVFEDSKRNRAYVLMDYIKGSNLELLRQKQPGQRFSLPHVLNIMKSIMDAVAFLHSQNPPIVHRDIKPANIIEPATGDEAMLVDFSIAKEYESEETTTAVRHYSPGYGAPEQYGIGTTPRTDIYGLGATMYTLLTGTVPVDALYRMIRIGENELDPLMPADQINPNVPKDIAEAIQRAMSLNSNARFSTVEQFWQALNANAAGQSLPIPSAVSSSQNHLPTISKDAEKRTATISLPKETSAVHFRRMSAILLILLVLLIGLSVGMNTLLSAKYHHPSSARSKVASTSTSASIVYPPLAEQYSGTIGYLGTNTKTKMALSGIQQNEGNLRGYFTGLGLSGPFKGTVSTSDHLQFQVMIYAGNETLSFEGYIQLGGNMAGTYQVLNQNNQFTGESGLWSAAPVPSG